MFPPVGPKCAFSLRPQQQDCVFVYPHSITGAAVLSIRLPALCLAFPSCANQMAMAWAREMIRGSSPEMESLNVQQMSSAKTCQGHVLLGGF